MRWLRTSGEDALESLHFVPHTPSSTCCPNSHYLRIISPGAPDRVGVARREWGGLVSGPRPEMKRKEWFRDICHSHFGIKGASGSGPAW